MLTCNRTDVFEGIDVSKISASIVTIGIFYIKDLHFNQLTQTAVMMY